MLAPNTSLPAGTDYRPARRAQHQWPLHPREALRHAKSRESEEHLQAFDCSTCAGAASLDESSPYVARGCAVPCALRVRIWRAMTCRLSQTVHSLSQRAHIRFTQRICPAYALTLRCIHCRPPNMHGYALEYADLEKGVNVRKNMRHIWPRVTRAWKCHGMEASESGSGIRNGSHSSPGSIGDSPE